MSALPMPALSVRPVIELDPRPVDWLWPCRLGQGKLAVLDGDPGLGKSLVALDLCARLSTGRPWPDGSPSPGPWPSFIIQGEDGGNDTLRPPLQALGADLARVFFPDGDDPLVAQPLRLPSRAPTLDGAIVRAGAQFRRLRLRQAVLLLAVQDNRAEAAPLGAEMGTAYFLLAPDRPRGQRIMHAVPCAPFSSKVSGQRGLSAARECGSCRGKSPGGNREVLS
jgi:hypothetical protein